MRKLLSGVAIGIGAAAVALLLGWTGWLEQLELLTYDWRMARAADVASASRDIVLVEINDASIRNLAPVVGRWPWPRAVHAQLVHYLARGRPRAILFDLALLEPDRPATYEFPGGSLTSTESDQMLADAVREAGNVVLLADAVAPGREGEPEPEAAWSPPAFRLGPQIEERPLITLPYERLASAAAGFGHNFLALDPGGSARRVLPFVRRGDRYMPSLGVAAALMGGRYEPEEVSLETNAIRIRDRVLPLVTTAVPGRSHPQQTLLINFRAPVHARGIRPYASYEARQLLEAEEQILSNQSPSLEPAVFQDKIVFVGLTASGLVDVFQTPLGRGTMPGIQLHASVADSILSNRFIQPARRRTLLASVVALAAATGLMSALLPFTAALAGAAIASAAWTAVAFAAFRQGLWLGLVQPLLGVSVALFAGTAYRYFVEDREKRKVKRLFGRYVSKDVYNQLLANPRLAELGGTRREMTVLFSDIRGFTSVTERGNPEALVAQLNEYFSCMVDIVFRHKGTVDKFVGDMVMALFGAPVDDPDHADHAVAAAVDMVRELAELNRRWQAAGRVPLDIGIGINTGEMIAGNIGSSAIMSYTVIGDNVNLGSRLESLNKEHGTRIIISDATRGRLTTPHALRPLGRVVVKGKSRPVEIHEVCVPSPLGTGEGPTGFGQEKIERVL
ncbi:MAG TPA: adenylate/guanylate cyclase domain-containing protein [Vicinamibacterales bacterium]|nr:adenylate/guanylate cyclase domain-containing protein [Vicinamibacterales bacterium]